MLRRHQHSFTFGEVVTNDVGNGVSFPRPRGSLNDATVALLQAVDDRNLFIVERFGEV